MVNGVCRLWRGGGAIGLFGGGSFWLIGGFEVWGGNGWLLFEYWVCIGGQWCIGLLLVAKRDMKRD